MTFVRFVDNDPAGLWKKGDLAEDLGWESALAFNDSVLQRLLKLERTGEMISVFDPYRRGLIEPCDTLP